MPSAATPNDKTFRLLNALRTAPARVRSAWRRRTAGVASPVDRRELERLALLRHFEYLKRYANDIVFLVDAERRIIEANDRACAAYGRPCAEFIGMSVQHIRAPQADADIAAHFALAERADGALYETLHQRSDGTVFPVEISMRAIDVEGSKFYQAIIRDITERKRAEAAIVENQAKLRALATELVLAEERERRRIAGGLHDRIGQLLALARMQLSSLVRADRNDPSAIQPADIIALLDDAIRETRSLTFELSPPILYTLGLEPALEWLAEEFQKKHGLPCRFETDGLAKPVDDAMRVLLFQGARELLANVFKHAQATESRVCILRGDDCVSVQVADNGRGFLVDEAVNLNSCCAGYGLFSLRERLAQHGGKLEIVSVLGQGAIATMSAPLPNG